MSDTNHAAFQNELNPFTERIVSGEKSVVKLRDGRVVRPLWHKGDETESPHFTTRGGKYMWNPDGTSVTTADFDMVSFLGSLDDI
jgi:hypothetical protein